MKTPSQQIKAMIRSWEGLRLQAYRCPAGVLTIGYGHTGNDVRAGMTITAAQAGELLDRDLQRTSESLAKLLGINLSASLSQGQTDALVSLAFNIGIGALSRSTLMRKLKANPADPSIGGEFVRWVYAGGKRQPGLERRRRAEAAFYFSK